MSFFFFGNEEAAVTKLKGLVDQHQAKAAVATQHGRMGKAAYHHRRAERYAGWAVEMILVASLP